MVKMVSSPGFDWAVMVPPCRLTMLWQMVRPMPKPLPLFVLLHLLCFSVPWLVPWLLWWLKPLLDRVVLYVLSRTLFGEVPTVRQLWRALPAEWWRDGVAAIWHILRFNLIRPTA